VAAGGLRACIQGARRSADCRSGNWWARRRARAGAGPPDGKVIVEFWFCLAAAFTVIRRLIDRACSRYRWPTRPTTRWFR